MDPAICQRLKLCLSIQNHSFTCKYQNKQLMPHWHEHVQGNQAFFLLQLQRRTGHSHCGRRRVGTAATNLGVGLGAHPRDHDATRTFEYQQEPSCAVRKKFVIAAARDDEESAWSNLERGGRRRGGGRHRPQRQSGDRRRPHLLAGFLRASRDG
jgi:hypothetical protein